MNQSNFMQMMNICPEGEISIERVDKDIGITYNQKNINRFL